MISKKNVTISEGDGERPSCSPCQKGSRRCEWPYSTAPASSQNGLTLPLQTPFVSTESPEIALQDIEVFRLFRHYTTSLASWYDLNDRHRHFLDVVPVRARQSPLLLSAILAFSAVSLHKSDCAEYMDKAEFYHLESVRILLEITKNIQTVVSNGEVLAAICLLRSYEIISLNLSSQSHLQGCYSILSSHPIKLESGLVRAAFWNYLREDITVALIEKRRLMIELSDEHYPKLENDDDYANYVTVLLGQVINQCFGNDVDPLELSRWNSLEQNLETWKNCLPTSFAPIIVKLPNEVGSAFPFIGALHPWHVAAWQYYQTAMIVLLLARPQLQNNTKMENIRHLSGLTRDLENRTSEICALALSSESQAVWINAFGPIAFCGCWLRDQNQVSEVVQGVQDWGVQTGWPVKNIVQSLQTDKSVADGF
ncbi:hypothetical protein N7474_006488 [Penicillium riverlandense]|uniref:uncharacterized protein n=1 Tax=Penicillium riverlandense TaxID=1903569 RepID=UPI0025477475|nr:uncharacterized protein N7474_006488 [Penicillium riverlandense]KAJ5814711.1 hypothetical protein N7474_006488 [Penicillium riverlandense]